jgi:hypothetical protein
MGDWFGGGGETQGSSPSYNNPKYAPPAYETPFGNWSYDGNTFKSTLAPQEQKQLDLSQSSYYDIMMQLPTDGAFGASTVNNFANPNSYLGAYNKAYTDVLDTQYGIPLRQKNAQQYGGDSTIGRAAENDLNTKIGNQGILNSANLAGTNYNSMLAGLTGVGGNINDIYKRMMGIAAQGRGQGQDFMANEQTNANRDFMDYIRQMNIMDQTNQANNGGAGDIFGQLGGMLGGGSGGGFDLSSLFGGGQGGGFLNQLMGMFGNGTASASPTGGIDAGYASGFGQLSQDELDYQNLMNDVSF